jgi:hypothetical protein
MVLGTSRVGAAALMGRGRSGESQFFVADSARDSLIPSAGSAALLHVPPSGSFALSLLPLTATRTVLSRVVSDPRARHIPLLRRAQFHPPYMLARYGMAG